MKIELKEVKDFSRKNLKKLLKADLDKFRLLKKGDLLSLFNFVSMLAGDEKLDVFITNCPLILANRENLEKNTGVKIMSSAELQEEMDGIGGKKTKKEFNPFVFKNNQCDTL